VPLVLKRNDRSGAFDRYFVYSGKRVVGTLMSVPSGVKQGWWHWSITGSRSAERPRPRCRYVAKPGRGHGGLCQAVANLAGVGGVEGTRG
jgi:hypothetical protein